ncbi:hypothetical protein ES288_D04G109200v1 [Gossypium darwinii]|uniref:Uncharacterized protein n=1 Tax=Gossypium darwinii TaxID=34276 RepID=A0A5D2CZW1_GOSDA|nr:hypothetical protein ES288_D04G109200v1 [Gossypium darwinii]
MLSVAGLEINERPLKCPFSDFEKLSICESSQREELKSRKVFFFSVHLMAFIICSDFVDLIAFFFLCLHFNLLFKAGFMSSFTVSAFRNYVDNIKLKRKMESEEQ